MAPDAKPGSGTGTQKIYPWDITGKFKLLYEHEGVGSDFNRTKPGALTSKKPNTPETPSGVATYNETTKQFNGSFGTYLGQHTGDPAADPATANAIDLHGKGDDHQTIDCQEGDKVKVIKVFLGADDAGTIGGLPSPDPDTIEINTFSVATELAKAKADLITAKAAKTEADAAVVDAKKAVTKAEKEVEKRKADVEAAIANYVKNAQKAVDAKKKAVEKAIAAEGSAKDAFDKVVASGAHPTSSKYKLAKSAYDQAVANRKAAEAALATAQEMLDKATADAEQDQSVVTARKSLVQAEADLAARQTDLTTKETAAADAKKAVDAASKVVEKYQQQQDSWVDVRKGTLEHEQGHRRILYAHLDKMTTMLKTLRVWGYAPKEERARAIAKKEFEIVQNKHIKIIIDQNKNMQGEGSGYDGVTQHGMQQGNWTQWQDGTYP